MPLTADELEELDARVAAMSADRPATMAAFRELRAALEAETARAEKAERENARLTERRFPIRGGPSIPWSAIAPYERNARSNHDQTLERLAERGGLDPSEAIDVLNGDRWNTCQLKGVAAVAEMLRLVNGGEAATLRAEQERLTREVETERMRLAACGVAAIQNTEATIADRLHADSPYASASYFDVCRAVDREMALRAEREALAARLQWQPMETAPKTGPVVSVLLKVPITRWEQSKQNTVVIGHRITGGHWAHGDGDGMMPAFGPAWFESDHCGGYRELAPEPVAWAPGPTGEAGPPNAVACAACLAKGLECRHLKIGEDGPR